MENGITITKESEISLEKLKHFNNIYCQLSQRYQSKIEQTIREKRFFFLFVINQQEWIINNECIQDLRYRQQRMYIVCVQNDPTMKLKVCSICNVYTKIISHPLPTGFMRIVIFLLCDFHWQIQNTAFICADVNMDFHSCSYEKNYAKTRQNCVFIFYGFISLLLLSIAVSRFIFRLFII